MFSSHCFLWTVEVMTSGPTNALMLSALPYVIFLICLSDQSRVVCIYLPGLPALGFEEII
jgi:hypothetical protein